MSLDTATKIPAITQIKGLSPLAVMALNAIKETIEVREGLHEQLDRFVSVRELADLILNDKDIIEYLGSGHSHDDRYFTKSQWDLNAKGDLNVAQGLDTPGTLSVGLNNQLIRADSGAALGIAYFTLQGTSNQVIVTHNASDATLSLPQNIHAAASPTFSALTLSNIVHGTADYDKFLVSDGGIIKYRTGTEILADIGAGAGGGDMLKSVYDTGNDGVVDEAETVDGGTW